MMAWIKEVLSASGDASSKRVAMLIATVSLALALLGLIGAAFAGRDVAAALWAVTIPLAGLGGYSYVGGIKMGEKP